MTELVARPLLNLKWPELAAVVQPIGGEWGVRRELLESLSIPVGYGLEMAVVAGYLAALRPGRFGAGRSGDAPATGTRACTTSG